MKTRDILVICFAAVVMAFLFSPADKVKVVVKEKYFPLHHEKVVTKHK